MNSIYFEYPYFFLVFFIFLLCMYVCPAKDDSLLFSNIKFIKQTKKKFSLLSVFKVLSIFFLTLTLTSPYSQKTLQSVKQKSISIVLDIDISGSMSEDFKDVKKILQEFLSKQSSSKIALVFFADSAQVASPLTHQKTFIKEVIKNTKVGDLGLENSAINDSIILSAKLLKEDDSKSKVLILLTDGIERGSINDTVTTKKYLKNQKLKFFAIGFGEDYDKEELKLFTKDVVESSDIGSLKQTFDKINKLYKSDEIRQKKVKNYLYQFPLFFAFLSLLFYTYLINKRSLL